MIIHWRYLRYVLVHKWFVLLAGLRIGAPVWRLLVHDLSKFHPSEWGPYATYFYAPPPPVQRSPFFTSNDDSTHKTFVMKQRRRKFDVAWLQHIHANAHHWQHWLLLQHDGSQRPLRMPIPVVREMVADWCGAGRAITGTWEVHEWYAKHKGSMRLHPSTKDLVEEILHKLEF